MTPVYGLLRIWFGWQNLTERFFSFQAGISAAPTRALSAVKNMNLPQQIKDKLPELPQAIKDLKL